MVTNEIKSFLKAFGTWKISGIENNISDSWLESVPLIVWENLKSKVFQADHSTFQISESQSFTFPNNLVSFVLDKLFEKDSDDENIVSVIANVLSKCPVDLKKIMAQNIYITGGCAMMPMLSQRLMNELKSHCENHFKLSKLSLKFGSSTFSPIAASWTGASVYSSLKGVSLMTKITINDIKPL